MDTSLIGLPNEIDASGWCRLAPYGDSRKTIGRIDGSTRDYIQRLDRDGAAAMAAGFNGLWGRLKRAIVSVPLYQGHPDLGRLAPEQAEADDHEVPVGSINRLEARADGLYAQVALFPAGQSLANEGLRWISPFWWTTEIELRTDGVSVVRPVELISGGLTRRPNIPGGEPLANAAPPPTPPKETMKPQLIGLLAARGIALANGASEDDTLSRLATLLQKQDADIATLNQERTALSNDKTVLANERAALVTERDTLRTQVATVTQERDTARTALSNERTARIETAVDLAIYRGQIPVAERAARRARITAAADPVAELTALSNETVKHTVGGTENVRGDRRADAAAGSVRERLHALCNEQMTKHGLTYQAAFDAVLAAHPDIAAVVRPPAA